MKGTAPSRGCGKIRKRQSAMMVTIKYQMGHRHYAFCFKVGARCQHSPLNKERGRVHFGSHIAFA